MAFLGEATSAAVVVAALLAALGVGEGGGGGGGRVVEGLHSVVESVGRGRWGNGFESVEIERQVCVCQCVCCGLWGGRVGAIFLRCALFKLNNFNLGAPCLTSHTNNH